MEPTQSERPRTLALSAAGCLGNLTLLMLIALIWADRYDASNSDTPVEDGALVTLVVAAGLLLVNGAGLCLSPRTRRLGLGVLLGTVLSVPVGFVIGLGFLSTQLS